MNKFYGFDLGDAESAVSCLEKGSADIPALLPIEGEKSFITAYAMNAVGRLEIGEKSCYQTEALKKGLRFKSRFLTDPSSRGDIKNFASGVLASLYKNEQLTAEEDCCFYIGSPAGWNANTRETYRSIFESAGYPPVKIVSESRAALISACQSKHLQVGYDILSKSMLVVDIGSSTTDFAYICGGKETAIQTAGEVQLGGGLMDECLLEECVESSPNETAIRQVFSDSSAWKQYCEFASRRLKEKYFGEQEYWREHVCSESILISYDSPVRLRLRMDETMAEHLLEEGMPQLDGRSFREVFTDSLRSVRDSLGGPLPELVFLTGGVSKLPAIRSWCIEVFPEAVTITGSEPEFSVCRGLAWSGRIDEQLREFRADLDGMIASTTVENIVKKYIRDLYTQMVEALTEPMIRYAAMPVLERWRRGEIKRLEETDTELAKETEHFLHTEEARQILSRVISSWLKPVAGELEEVTMPLCIRHNVPYTALSLNSYLSVSDLDFSIEAKDVFAVDEITWMIDSIITVIVGLLCGGSGIALISGGLTGIAAGAALSLLVLTLGKEPMQKAILHTNIPRPLRHMASSKAFEKRINEVSSSVKDNFYRNLDDQKNAQMTETLVAEISEQIENCLIKMAEIVEIPLG